LREKIIKASNFFCLIFNWNHFCPSFFTSDWELTFLSCYFQPINQPLTTTFMSELQLKELEAQIAELKGKLTGDMFQDMDVRDQIHNLEMKLKGVKPMDSSIDCVGCGS